ncbi:MAG: HAMP domain-containing protein [Desulfobacterales bacterium]|nr:HAMP domain-containing protein [Desulfobacterales bacterium]
MNPNKKPAPFKRRQVYIKKEFQTRFIAKFFSILILSGVISIGLTLFNTSDSLTTTYMNSKLVIQNTSFAIMPSVIYTTLITTVLVGIVVIGVTLLVSHKIAGPMYRFELDIKRVTEGDLKSRIHIRKGDQFQELANSLNAMIDSLAGRVEAIKKDTEAAADGQATTDEIRNTINANFKL